MQSAKLVKNRNWEMLMEDISTRFEKICEKIAKAEMQYHRQPHSVTLLAASKTRTVDEIKAAIDCGQLIFGESYVQEALPKIEELTDKNIEWHFIGPVQSNKTKYIAQYFSWVHGVDRLKIAERLNAQRSPYFPSLNVCIEVNLSGETSKSGISPRDIIPLAQKIITLPNLKLRGLMTIPAPNQEVEKQRAIFRQLRHLLEDLNLKGFQMDTLSMGMTDDFEAAIAEGSTIVRIGTALFGPR